MFEKVLLTLGPDVQILWPNIKFVDISELFFFLKVKRQGHGYMLICLKKNSQNGI